MTNFIKSVSVQLRTRLIRDVTGASAVEYVLIAAIVGAGLIGGASVLGTQLNSMLNTIGTTVQSYSP
jgi:pilus assembly protein Flp/PilA